MVKVGQQVTFMRLETDPDMRGQVMAINGEDVEDCTMAEARDLMLKSGDMLGALICQRAAWRSHSTSA